MRFLPRKPRLLRTPRILPRTPRILRTPRTGKGAKGRGGGIAMLIALGMFLAMIGIGGQDDGGSVTTAGRQADLTGMVTRVRDGDTIVVGNTPVRIANLDCAEMGTAEGGRAREAMLRIARQGPMSCQLEGRMSYDREVGTCSVSGGGDIGEIMIASGACARWR